FLPYIKNPIRFDFNNQVPPDRSVRLQQTEDLPNFKIFNKSFDQRPTSVNHYNKVSKTPRFNPSFNIDMIQSNENCSSHNYTSLKTQHFQPCKNKELVFNSSSASSSSENAQESDNDNDILPKSRKFFLKSERNQKSAQSVQFGFQNNSDLISEEKPIVSSRLTSVNTIHDDKHVSASSSVDTKSLNIRICTLFRKLSVKIPIETTVKDLISIIWQKIQFNIEPYTKDSHILLLFNHRLHIFIESDSTTLVQDFILLTPPSSPSSNDPTDFYIYGLSLEQAASMYNFDNDYISLFCNSDSWCPSYFIEYKQSKRSQSIFLSSLYALRMYFRPEHRELVAKQLAMEAQFFLELRKYLFPPAILALKHAIIGSMFWFEKSLLMDGLIQLLIHLRDRNIGFVEEIFDFIPLLICWLLEKCDLSAEKVDYFREVRLINDQKCQPSYFQNPVTTSKIKRQTLLLEEFNVMNDYDLLQYHVDIRSCDDYVIYDPIIQDLPILDSLKCWTDIQVKELYKTIARTPEYRSFNIITRGGVTADVKNQLVLLHEDQEHHEMLIIFSKYLILSNVQWTINLFLWNLTHSSIEKEALADPHLPLYLHDALNDITRVNVDSSLNNNNKSVPATQVSVILLDRSRSMSDYRIASSDKNENCTHMGICRMMLGRLSNNILSTNEVHAFGLIEFATKYKTVCPITRSREQFEKALSFDDCRGDWTCMYDAIREAIKHIKTFTDSPLRASKDCKKLIICLSDGINNSGDTKIQTLYDLIKTNNIVIDFISFVCDEQLIKKNEITKAQEFRKLCTESGGYIYRNLNLLSDIELAALFEQEAAVWLSKRSRTSYGIIDKPVRYISSAFQEKANRQLPSDSAIQNSSRSRRILNELHAMLKYPSEDIIVFAVSKNIAFWKVILKGPEETPYQGKFWMLFVEFDSHYPNCPPNVRFVTPIYHVNISGDGKICHQILGRCWSMQTKMSVIFENILDLLKKPNFDDAISCEKAHLYKESPNDYKREAKDHSNKYAKNDFKTLKDEYRLEDDDNQIDESL
ncbi:unnamed protein product, partial [Rotaria sp. Silwood1]